MPYVNTPPISTTQLRYTGIRDGPRVRDLVKGLLGISAPCAGDENGAGDG